jgi:hypothetical protein
MTTPIQVTNPKDYGVDYFAIEREDDRYGWSVPAWEEIGWAELCGPFTTREAAQAVLNEALQLMGGAK